MFSIKTLLRLTPSKRLILYTIAIAALISVVLSMSLAYFFFVHHPAQNSTSKTSQHYNYDEALLACGKASATSSTGCYRQVILDIYKDKGLIPALDLTKKISNQEPGFQLYCHTMMHELGKESYTSFHQTGNLDITDQLSYCNYGFYHSFMEEMLSAEGGVAEAKKFCDFVGTQLKNQSSAVYNCYHGIGHGISSEPTEKSDPIKMLTPGLLVCRTISEDTGLQSSCDTGVFNSIELLYGDPTYNLPMPANPFLLCINDTFNDIEKDACYVEMAVLANDMSRESFGTTLDFTNIVPIEFRAYAIQYTSVYANALGFEHAKTVMPECRRVAPQYVNSCAKGVATGLVVYGKADNKYESAISFYRDTSLSETEKNAFLGTLLGMDTYTLEERQARCNEFPEDMRIDSICKVSN